MDTPLYDRLIAQGFDKTKRGFNRGYRPECSQCAARVINGTACHEIGCPHAMHECKGCNTLVPVRVKYCPDCQ